MRLAKQLTYVAAMAVLVASPLAAEPANPYESIGNPYLFLLREPTVWEDLKLTGKQREDLTEFNARIDGPLLALRNWPNDVADKKFAELVSETETAATAILSHDQQLRVQQIMLRVRGIDCVLVAKVAEALQLSWKQNESIQKIVKETQAATTSLREQANGGKPREPLEKEFARLQNEKKKQILAELTSKQRELLTALLGRGFDVSKVGKFAFKAPELISGGTWINSQPLRLEQLRGQVVAVHVWTFG